MPNITRRQFLAASAAAAALGRWPRLSWAAQAAAEKPAAYVQFGLVTYQWGKDWDLPALLENCEATGVLGVELRTEHLHGVDLPMAAGRREEVRLRFENSPVTLVGLGTNWSFHHTDAAELKRHMEMARGYITLSHDVGGTGVKVKPDKLPKEASQDQTIEQIGRCLSELAEFGEGFGQQIRLEVHGDCRPLPIIKKIMDVADHPNATICWNSNAADLDGAGLEANYNLVKHRFGDTVHIHRLDGREYPHQRLIDLLRRDRYAGWCLLEEGQMPEGDIVEALRRQRELWDRMIQGG